MVNAIARTIPTVNTNRAGFGLGFSAMYPLLAPVPLVPVPVLVPVCRTFRGANRKRCVSYFTLRTILILMETIKDLDQTPTAHPPPPSPGACAKRPIEPMPDENSPPQRSKSQSPKPRQLPESETRPRRVRQCQVCNETFTTARKDAKYRSSKCRLRAFRNEGEGGP